MRMVSEQEKEKRRRAARAAQRRQALEARGYQPEEAKQVVSAIQSALEWARLAALARQLGGTSPAKALEQQAVASTQQAIALVAKHEPRVAEAVAPLMRAAQAIVEAR